MSPSYTLQSLDIQMGVYLSQPNKQKTIKEAQGKYYSYVSAEMQGWRKTMEDACIHTLDLGDGNSLFGVFDGHGGFEVSKYVGQIFETQLKKSNSYKQKMYKDALIETFKRIDEILESSEGQSALYAIRYSNDTPQSQVKEGEKEFIGGSVGCTANVMLVTPNAYFVANAGDSRSVLCRDGKSIDLSKDHKPDSAEEENRIKAAGGYISMGRVNGGLNLTRSFGDFDYKKNKSLQYDQQMITCNPDVSEVEKKTGDEFVLMGCDGIWEKYVDNSQGIIDIVREQVKKGTDKRKIAEDLLEQLVAPNTNSGIGCDNMTIILVLIHS